MRTLAVLGMALLQVAPVLLSFKAGTHHGDTPCAEGGAAWIPVVPAGESCPDGHHHHAPADMPILTSEHFLPDDLPISDPVAPDLEDSGFDLSDPFRILGTPATAVRERAPPRT